MQVCLPELRCRRNGRPVELQSPLIAPRDVGAWNPHIITLGSQSSTIEIYLFKELLRSRGKRLSHRKRNRFIGPLRILDIRRWRRHISDYHWRNAMFEPSIDICFQSVPRFAVSNMSSCIPDAKTASRVVCFEVPLRIELCCEAQGRTRRCVCATFDHLFELVFIDDCTVRVINYVVIES